MVEESPSHEQILQKIAGTMDVLELKVATADS